MLSGTERALVPWLFWVLRTYWTLCWSETSFWDLTWHLRLSQVVLYWLLHSSLRSHLKKWERKFVECWLHAQPFSSAITKQTHFKWVVFEKIFMYYYSCKSLIATAFLRFLIYYMTEKITNVCSLIALKCRVKNQQEIGLRSAKTNTLFMLGSSYSRKANADEQTTEIKEWNITSTLSWFDAFFWTVYLTFSIIWPIFTLIKVEITPVLVKRL